MGKDVLVFSKDIQLTDADSKTNQFFEFELEEDFSRLFIDTVYFPKFYYNLEKTNDIMQECIKKYDLTQEIVDSTEDCFPLRNFINFSIDKGEKYIGSVIRHPNAQHIEISETYSSDGFSAEKPSKGMWRISLNIFCVTTGTCEFKIRITGVK